MTGTKRSLVFFVQLTAASLGLCLAAAFGRAQAETVTNRFGFAGKEIFPIDQLISQLRAADLDGDGLQDLLVVNNARSKINLLYNQTGHTNSSASSPWPVKRELNALPPDARFRIDSIPSEKRIWSLLLTDLNSDGRADIAYFGEPKELVVLYNQGQSSWSAPRRWPLEDGLLNPNALVAGDLNADGRTDLLLLAEGHIYWLAGTGHDSLAEPEKIPYSGSLQALQVLDIQGDGRQDLLLVNWDDANPFRFRLQRDDGHLGPELYFTLPPIRSYLADDLDRDGQAEVVTVALNSGRAQVSHFTRRPAEPLAGEWRQGQLEILPLNKTAKARRGLAWADIDGDARPDLLAAEPDRGQLTVYRQQADGSLADGKSFATFAGVSELAVADWDGDGTAEIFALSSDERQIGVTRLDENGRMAFPRLVPFPGRPLAMAVGAVAPGAKPSLVAIVDREGRRELHVRDAAGQDRHQQLSENFKANPAGVVIHDANQDGLPDIVIPIPYEKIKVLLQVQGEEYSEQDVLPPGGSSEQPWVGTADLDGDGKPELLLAQRNFLRAVVLQPEPNQPGAASAWSFVVKAQINGAAGTSRIVGAAALSNGANCVPSIFLLDAERKLLTLCNRDPAGAWQVVRNLRLPLSDFTDVQAVALGQDDPNSIAFFGLNSVAWLELHGPVWDFTELDSYETPIQDGYLNDVISGDLNQDGRKDLVFLETAKSYLDIVTYERPHQLVPANRWQVFEERSFRSRRSSGPEPREALIADFTGDGKNDLVVLVHDRVILYPQE